MSQSILYYFLTFIRPLHFIFFFFLNNPAPTDIYPFPLRDALPICRADVAVVGTRRARRGLRVGRAARPAAGAHLRRVALARRAAADDEARLEHVGRTRAARPVDRKSTRLNSSHLVISYAVFCLKKK